MSEAGGIEEAVVLGVGTDTSAVPGFFSEVEAELRPGIAAVQRAINGTDLIDENWIRSQGQQFWRALSQALQMREQGVTVRGQTVLEMAGINLAGSQQDVGQVERIARQLEQALESLHTRGVGTNLPGLDISSSLNQLREQLREAEFQANRFRDVQEVLAATPRAPIVRQQGGALRPVGQLGNEIFRGVDELPEGIGGATHTERRQSVDDYVERRAQQAEARVRAMRAQLDALNNYAPAMDTPQPPATPAAPPQRPATPATPPPPPPPPPPAPAAAPGGDDDENARSRPFNQSPVVNPNADPGAVDDARIAELERANAEAQRELARARDQQEWHRDTRREQERGWEEEPETRPAWGTDWQRHQEIQRGMVEEVAAAERAAAAAFTALNEAREEAARRTSAAGAGGAGGRPPGPPYGGRTFSEDNDGNEVEPWRELTDEERIIHSGAGRRSLQETVAREDARMTLGGADPDDAEAAYIRALEDMTRALRRREARLSDDDDQNAVNAGRNRQRQGARNEKFRQETEGDLTDEELDRRAGLNYGRTTRSRVRAETTEEAHQNLGLDPGDHERELAEVTERLVRKRRRLLNQLPDDLDELTVAGTRRAGTQRAANEYVAQQNEGALGWDEAVERGQRNYAQALERNARALDRQATQLDRELNLLRMQGSQRGATRSALREEYRQETEGPVNVDDMRAEVRREEAARQQAAADRSARERLHSYVQDPSNPFISRVAASARGTSGSVATEFRKGYFGGMNTDLGQQLGQTARFSTLYGGFYTALNALSQGLTAIVQDTVQYEAALTDLQVATGRSREGVSDLATNLGNVATSAGFGQGEGVAAGARAIGLYGVGGAGRAEQDRVSEETVRVSTMMARVSGTTIEQAQQQLAAVSNSFGMRPEQSQEIFDQLVVISRATGQSTLALADATANVGTLAEAGGFSMAEITAAIAQITPQAGSPDAASGALRQVLSKGGDRAFQANVESQFAGIEAVGRDLPDIINQIVTEMPQRLTEFSLLFGRGASQSAVLTMGRDWNRIQENAAAAESAPAGEGTKFFEDFQKQIGERFRVFIEQMKALGTELMRSGALHFLGLLLEIMTQMARVATQLVQAFNAIPEPLRAVAFGAAEMYAVMALLGTGLPRFLQPVRAAIEAFIVPPKIARSLARGSEAFFDPDSGDRRPGAMRRGLRSLFGGGRDDDDDDNNAPNARRRRRGSGGGGNADDPADRQDRDERRRDRDEERRDRDEQRTERRARPPGAPGLNPLQQGMGMGMGGALGGALGEAMGGMAGQMDPTGLLDMVSEYMPDPQDLVDKAKEKLDARRQAQQDEDEERRRRQNGGSGGDDDDDEDERRRRRDNDRDNNRRRLRGRASGLLNRNVNGAGGLLDDLGGMLGRVSGGDGISGLLRGLGGNLGTAASGIGGRLAAFGLGGPIGLAAGLAYTGISGFTSDRGETRARQQESTTTLAGARSSADLRRGAEQARAAEEAARQEQDWTFWSKDTLSLGLATGWANTFGGADDRRRQAREQAENAEKRAQEMEEAEKREVEINEANRFGQFGNMEELNNALKDLTDRGYNAAERVQMLNSAFRDLVNLAQSGGVALIRQGQGERFGQAMGAATTTSIDQVRAQAHDLADAMDPEEDSWLGFLNIQGENSGYLRDLEDKFAGIDPAEVQKRISDRTLKYLRDIGKDPATGTHSLSATENDEVQRIALEEGTRDFSPEELAELQRRRPDIYKMYTQGFKTAALDALRKEFGGGPVSATAAMNELLLVAQEAELAGQEAVARSNNPMDQFTVQLQGIAEARRLAAIASQDPRWSEDDRAKFGRQVRNFDLQTTQVQRQQATLQVETRGAQAMARIDPGNSRARIEQQRQNAIDQQALLNSATKEYADLADQIQNFDQQLRQNLLDYYAAFDLGQIGLSDTVAQAQAAEADALRRLNEAMEHGDAGAQWQAYNNWRRSQQATLDATAERAQAERDQNIDPDDTVENANARYRNLVAERERLLQGNVNDRTKAAQMVPEITKAHRDAIFAQLQRRLEEEQAALDPRDRAGDLQARLADAYNRLANTPEKNRAPIQQEINQMLQEQQQYQIELANAEIESTLGISDSGVDRAQGALQQAENELGGMLEGTPEYVRQMGIIQSLKYDLAQAELDAASTIRRLGIDISDPVAMARAALQDSIDRARTARSAEARRGAELQVRQDRIALEGAEFSQRLTDVRNAESLGRISHQEYLQYLQAERARLQTRLNGMRTTDAGYRQIQDQITELDMAMKTSADALSGQWNIGEIDVPTIYEVRRAIAERGGRDNGAAGGTVNNNQVLTVNGADFARVIQYINGILGQPATVTRTIANRKG